VWEPRLLYPRRRPHATRHHTSAPAGLWGAAARTGLLEECGGQTALGQPGGYCRDAVARRAGLWAPLHAVSGGVAGARATCGHRCCYQRWSSGGMVRRAAESENTHVTFRCSRAW